MTMSSLPVNTEVDLRIFIKAATSVLLAGQPMFADLPLAVFIKLSSSKLPSLSSTSQKGRPAS